MQLLPLYLALVHFDLQNVRFKAVFIHDWAFVKVGTPHTAVTAPPVQRGHHACTAPVGRLMWQEACVKDAHSRGLWPVW